MDNETLPPKRPPTMPPIEHMRNTVAQNVAASAIEVVKLVERRQDIRATLARAERSVDDAKRELDDVNAMISAARAALVEATGEVS